MINCNGKLVSSLSDVDETIILNLFKGFSIEEKLRFSKGNILLWETHYFRIIAALRRHRFNIPLEFTMEYLSNEILKTLNKNLPSNDDQLIHLKFIKNDIGVFFIIIVDKIPSFSLNSDDIYTVDLYKEEWIASGFFSNLSSTNLTIREISETYAEENGLEDCILLNDQKNLVEATSGSLYLVQGNLILSPNLDSGCQDFAIRAAFNQWVVNEQQDYSLVEQAVNPFELQKSEEIIILSIENGVQPITNYRKTTYSQLRVGLVFERFLKQLD